jgi:hypothetical protein
MTLWFDFYSEHEAALSGHQTGKANFYIQKELFLPIDVEIKFFNEYP